MRKFNYVKPICVLFALSLVSFLSACVDGESAQLQIGRRMMREYLSGRGMRTYLTESHADVLRPDADKLILSDFVKGRFSDCGEDYEFAVNVVTGEIYTSEQIPAFSDSCIRMIEEQLGLDSVDCMGKCAVWTDAPAWVNGNSEWPYKTTYLGKVVPVSITDMDAYAVQSIKDGNIRLDIDLVCRGAPLSTERWSLSDTEDWNNTTVTLYGISGELPTKESFTEDYLEDFSGDVLKLSREKILFQPETATADTLAQPAESHKTPKEQVEVFLEEKDVWYQGGSPD